MDAFSNTCSFDYVKNKKNKKRKSVENQKHTANNTWLCFFFLSQGSYLEIKKQMDKLDPLAHPLLQWWVDGSGSENMGLLLLWTLTGFDLIPESKIQQCSFAESKQMIVENIIMLNELYHGRYKKMFDVGPV